LSVSCRFFRRSLIDTSSERGFMEDINSGLNAVRKAIESVASCNCAAVYRYQF
jgi:hypothetical protein